MGDDDVRFPRGSRVMIDVSGRVYRGQVRLVDGTRRFVKFDNGSTGWLPIDRLAAEDTP